VAHGRQGSSVIRDATPEDAAAVSELVHASFRAHVAADWEMVAQETLLTDTSAEKLAARIAESVIVLVHEEAGAILGVIQLPRPTLVQLCFVAPGHVGRGIGRSLWEAARTRLEERFPEVKTVELNSSPYAVAAYKALGFYPISEPFHRGGAVATRMACWLPARALARAQGAA
jgi:GNAT superfamily N-acetyltransferase